MCWRHGEANLPYTYLSPSLPTTHAHSWGNRPTPMPHPCRFCAFSTAAGPPCAEAAVQGLAGVSERGRLAGKRKPTQIWGTYRQGQTYERNGGLSEKWEKKELTPH